MKTVAEQKEDNLTFLTFVKNHLVYPEDFFKIFCGQTGQRYTCLESACPTEFGVKLFTERKYKDGC